MLIRIRSLNEVHIGESNSDIKEVKGFMDGISQQLATLIDVNPIALYIYNQFGRDFCIIQVNFVNVLRRQATYNLYSNTYNPR